MPRSARSLVTFVVFLLFSLSARASLAFPIAFDPQGFAGPYQTGPTAAAAGPRTIELSQGNYLIAISDCARLPFSVLADGSVTTTYPAALDASGNTIRFKSTTVSFDPADYTGLYNLSTLGAARSGPSSEVLVKGLSSCPLLFDDQGLRFSVDANGNISAQNPGSAESLGSTLRFITVPVTFDTAGYTGTYNLGSVSKANRSGPSTAVFVAGVTSYAFVMGDAAFRFNVANDGRVTPTPAAAGVGDIGRLTLDTASVTIFPDAYTGLYNLGAVSSQNRSGVSSAQFVRGVSSYQVLLGDTGIRINVGADGTVTPQNPANGTGGAGTFRFNTVVVSVDPDAYSGLYSLGSPSPAQRSGPSSAAFVPGVGNYQVIMGDTGFRFNVKADGTVAVNAASGVASGSTLRFNTSIITFDPGTSAASYVVSGYPGARTGATSAVLVPGVSNYGLTTGNQGGRFAISAPCAVVPPVLTVANTSFALRCGALDTTLPTVAFVDTPELTNQRDLAVTGSVQDAGGIASVTFTLNGGAPVAVVPNASGLVTTTLALSEGTNTVVLRATDEAGNVGSTSVLVRLDSVAPTVQVLSPTEGQAQGSSLVRVTLHVTDASATIATIGGIDYPVPPSGIVSEIVDVGGEGEREIFVSVRDAAGNSSVATTHVLVDTSAPIVESDLADGARFAALPGDVVPFSIRVDDAVATTVTFSFGATYDLPRGGGVLYVSAPLVPGHNTVTIRVSSEAGHETTVSRTVVYDVVAPSVSVSSIANVRGVAELVAFASDALTGVDALSFRVDGGQLISAVRTNDAWLAAFDTATIADGEHRLDAYATDGVGNVGSATTTIGVDNTAPSVSFTAPVTSVVGGIATVSVAVSDASGAASTEISVNGGAPLAQCSATGACSASVDTTTLGGDGPFTVTVRARDAAGNEATLDRVLVADNSAPARFIVSPADGSRVGASALLSLAVDDASFVSLECTIDGATVLSSTSSVASASLDFTGRLDGAYVIDCAARDAAGNVGHDVVTVFVDASVERLTPRTLNLKSNGGASSVTLAIDGPNAHLLDAAEAPPIAVVAPNGAPVYATNVRRTTTGVEAKIDRQALVASIRGGLAGSTPTSITVRVFAGAREIGRDTIAVTH